MNVRTLSPRLQIYLEKHQLQAFFEKQSQIFLANPRHPGLHTELLEPKDLALYSFRITKKYRAIFVSCGDGSIEIIDINNHYS